MKNIILVFSVAVLLSSCNRVYDAPLHEGEEPHYYVNTINSFTITIQGIVEKAIAYYEMGDSSISSIIGSLIKVLGLDPNTNLTCVTLSYNTIDPYGNPVVATGSFFYPEDLKKAKVMEVLPCARLNWWCNSLDLISGNIIDELLFSFFGQITLFPDMIGGAIYSDDNMAKYLRSFINEPNNGRVAYDMRRAVAEYLYLNENGFRLPTTSTLIGYSLGGHFAMEAAEYYTENTDVKVEEVYCAGGIYDANVAFHAYSKWDNMPYVAVPYVILSTAKYYNLLFDYSKVFIGDMANSNPVESAADGGDGYAYWFDNTHSAAELSERWGEDLHTYMHPDFFAPEPTGEFKKMLNVFSQNSITENFYPDKRSHIHIFHSVEDDFVPFECAQTLYDALKQRSDNVYLHTLRGGHTSLNMFVNFFLKMVILMNTSGETHTSEDFNKLLEFTIDLDDVE